MDINKENMTYLSKPLAFFLVIVILCVSLFYFGISQIKTVISKNDEVKKQQALLNQKINALEKVTEVISGDTTFLDVVIPSKLSSLYGLSQIKNQAIVNNLILSNIKISSAAILKDGINKTSISFDVEGLESSVYDFFDSFSKILPLMSIDKIKISKTDTATHATATLAVYSSELPKKIPSVTSEAPSLTTDEINLLQELSTFKMPIFVEPKSQESNSRENPFN